VHLKEWKVGCFLKYWRIRSQSITPYVPLLP